MEKGSNQYPPSRIVKPTPSTPPPPRFMTKREREFNSGYNAFTPGRSPSRSCPYLDGLSRIDRFDGWEQAKIDYKKEPTWQDQPTEVGYWWWIDGGIKRCPCIVYVSEIGETMGRPTIHIDINLDDFTYETHAITGKWYGPIVPPNE